ncbi:MAG TPA: adenylate/guanylate cyclase domain-containing protein [Thermoplasmata archaeon]|jgi:class 3 adenylate cyclase
MSAKVVVPLLEAMVPQGLRVGGNYLVEFEPGSPWYEASITIAARAVQSGLKTEYHSFHQKIVDVKEALEELGLSVDVETKRGRLRLIDSYTPEAGKVRTGPRGKVGFLSDRAPHVGRWQKAIRKQIADGIEEPDKKWLHIDDNTSLLLQFTDEESMLNGWRTVFIPWGRARELITINGFVKRVASEAFYRKNESLYDGVFDMVTTEKEGRLEHHIRARMVRGESIDSGWKPVRLRPRGEVVIGEPLPSRGTRHLTAVMFTDMVGYSKLMRKGEREALKLLDAQERAIRSTIPRFEGSVIKGTGDGFLVEFGSALSAAECAVAVQRQMRRVKGGNGVRIGIHVGDVIHRGGDIFGDAVNIASRLQALARPGGICISQQVHEQISGKISSSMRYRGTPSLKNITQKVGVYELIPASR